VHGVAQLPMHGASLRSTFDDPAAPAPRSVQYFEQMGHRGLWADGWKITTYHEQGQPFDDDEWGLFDLTTDFSECHDLRDAEPDRLRELIELWWAEAGANGVLPLDDRSIELFAAPPLPGTVHARRDYVYLPPMSHVPADASPPLGGRAWTIDAEVDVPRTGAEGVLYARGSHNVGHTFFVKDGSLHFDYNAMSTHHRATAPVELAPGPHTLTARFDREGRGGVLSIGVDGEDLASVDIPQLVRMPGSTGVDIGRDGLSTVVRDYDPPFAWTGTIHRVTFRIRSRADAAEIAATARAELSKE
jgi:hypothetical protein